MPEFQLYKASRFHDPTSPWSRSVLDAEPHVCLRQAPGASGCMGGGKDWQQQPIPSHPSPQIANYSPTRARGAEAVVSCSLSYSACAIPLLWTAMPWSLPYVQRALLSCWHLGKRTLEGVGNDVLCPKFFALPDMEIFQQPRDDLQAAVYTSSTDSQVRLTFFANHQPVDSEARHCCTLFLVSGLQTHSVRVRMQGIDDGCPC